MTAGGIVKKPDQKVPLALTEDERKLILEDLVYVEDDYAAVIRATLIPLLNTLAGPFVARHSRILRAINSRSTAGTPRSTPTKPLTDPPRKRRLPRILERLCDSVAQLDRATDF